MVNLTDKLWTDYERCAEKSIDDDKIINSKAELPFRHSISLAQEMENFMVNFKIQHMKFISDH